MRKKSIVIAFMLIFLCPYFVYAKNLHPFEGSLDFSKRKLVLKMNFPPQGNISLELSEDHKNNYHLDMDVDHVPAASYDISTSLAASFGWKKKEESSPALAGVVQSKYSLLNYKPIPELKGSFEIADQKLNITDLSFGAAGLNGVVDLFSPFKMNLLFKLTAVEMTDFLSFWMGEAENLNSDGLVSGQIQVSGIPESIHLKGRLASYEGFVGDLEYDSIILNLEGMYPIVQLLNSKVAQRNGLSFKVEGSVDLSNRHDFYKEIVALRTSPVVTENQDYMEWTIKSQKVGSKENTSELKYLLRKGQEDQNIPLRDETSMFGIKRENKF